MGTGLDLCTVMFLLGDIRQIVVRGLYSNESVIFQLLSLGTGIVSHTENLAHSGAGFLHYERSQGHPIVFAKASVGPLSGVL